MITNSEIFWAQKYRPRTIAETVLPESLKAQLQGFIDKTVLPNHTFAGRAGVGKTTAALAICDQLGYETMVLNGSGDDRGIDAVKSKVQRFANTVSMDGSRKCIIYNEADQLTNDAQLALRAIIEDVSKNCTFILTCNYPRKIDDAILSRCPVIEFSVPVSETERLMAEIFKICRKVLKAEAVENDPAAVASIVKQHFPDVRKTLGILQKLASAGKIEEGAVADATAGDAALLLDALKTKSMGKLNRWVAETSFTIDALNAWIEENREIFADEASEAQAYVDGADHDYKNAFVADQRLNLKAFCVKLASKCKFKP